MGWCEGEVRCGAVARATLGVGWGGIRTGVFRRGVPGLLLLLLLLLLGVKECGLCELCGVGCCVAVGRRVGG